jgi:hypothetical protein
MGEFSRSGGRVGDPAQQEAQKDRQEQVRKEAEVAEHLRGSDRLPWWRRLFRRKPSPSA